MNARAIVLRDTDGRAVKTMDVSELDHDNPQAPYAVSVETQCDMGEWHQGERVELVCWGPRVSSPS